MENAATAPQAARSLPLTVERHCDSRRPRRPCRAEGAWARSAPAGLSGTTSADGAALSIDEQSEVCVVAQLIAPPVRAVLHAHPAPRDHETVEDEVHRERGDDAVQEHVEPGGGRSDRRHRWPARG